MFLDFLVVVLFPTNQWATLTILQTADGKGVAFVELLCVFVGRGYKFQLFSDLSVDFCDALKHFKRTIVAIMATPDQTLIPGLYRSTEAYKCGRALPKGAIFGARPLFTFEELERFAGILLEGCGQSLTTWRFPLSMCCA